MLRPLIGERIRLEVVLNAKASLVNVDPSQITQLLMNLAVNARDAMPDGGRLLIRTEDVNLDQSPREGESRFSDVGERPGPDPYVSLSAVDMCVVMDEQ